MKNDSRKEFLAINSIEWRLLLGTASLKPDAGSLDEIRNLLRQPIDWDLLISQSLIHGTIGLLYKNCLKAGEEMVPDEVAELLKKYYVMVACSGLRQLADLKRVARSLADRGLPIMILKGMVLVDSIYGGDFGLRPMSDVDILVREQDWPEIYGVLLQSAFRPVEKNFNSIMPKLTKYDVEAHVQYTSDSGSCLEFQFDLLTLGIGMRNIMDVWDRSRETQIEGVRVLLPSPEDQLLHLVIHANRHGCSRLKWLVDIVEILKAGEKIDWDLFIEIANGENVSSCVYSTLAHIERLFGNQYLPRDVIERLKPGFYQKFLWQMAWPQEKLDEFQGRHEDAICFYYYRPLSGWNLVNFALTGRMRDKLGYQLRWIFPSFTWMSQTYGKPKSLGLIGYYLIRLLNRQQNKKAAG